MAPGYRPTFLEFLKSVRYVDRRKYFLNYSHVQLPTARFLTEISFEFFSFAEDDTTDSNSTVDDTNLARTHRSSREPSIPEVGVHFMREWHLAIRTMWSRHACSTQRCMRGVSSRERALANWLTNALVSATTTSLARLPGRTNSG